MSRKKINETTLKYLQNRCLDDVFIILKNSFTNKIHEIARQALMYVNMEIELALVAIQKRLSLPNDDLGPSTK